MVTLLETVDAAILRDDSESAVTILESLSGMGQLSGEDEITLGILLMFPPFVDEPESLRHFRLATGSNRRREAVVWGCYLVDTLYPVTDEFVPILAEASGHPESVYMLAKHFAGQGRVEDARSLIRELSDADLFPNALLLKANLSETYEQAQGLRRIARSLVKAIFRKGDPVPVNRKEVFDSYWSELIRGEIMSHHVWDYHFEKLP